MLHLYSPPPLPNIYISYHSFQCYFNVRLKRRSLWRGSLADPHMTLLHLHHHLRVMIHVIVMIKEMTPVPTPTALTPSIIWTRIKPPGSKDLHLKLLSRARILVYRMHRHLPVDWVIVFNGLNNGKICFPSFLPSFLPSALLFIYLSVLICFCFLQVAITSICQESEKT